MTIGKFVTFEGGEGTGKSTQIQLLAEYLRLRGLNVIVTREPGGSAGAELIRALLVNGDVNRWSGTSEALLLNAARVDHWTNVIQPALQKGSWVLCDRFADSTVAYQGYGRGVSLEFLLGLHKSILQDATPNRTYVFDLDPKVGIERALSRHTGENRFENMDLSFHERMRQGYLAIAHKNPERCLIVDANREIQVVFKGIREDAEALLQ